jgi:hypothetical protein
MDLPESSIFAYWDEMDSSNCKLSTLQTRSLKENVCESLAWSRAISLAAGISNVILSPDAPNSMPGNNFPQFKIPELKGLHTTLCSPPFAATVLAKWSLPFSPPDANPKTIALAARRFSRGKNLFNISSVLERYWISSAIALEIETIILLQQQCGTQLNGCMALAASLLTTVH